MNRLSDIYVNILDFERDEKVRYLVLYYKKRVSYTSNRKVDGCKSWKKGMIDIVARVFLRVSTENISFGKIARVTRKFTHFFQREQQCDPRRTPRRNFGVTVS